VPKHFQARPTDGASQLVSHLGKLPTPSTARFILSNGALRCQRHLDGVDRRGVGALQFASPPESDAMNVNEQDREDDRAFGFIMKTLDTSLGYRLVWAVDRLGGVSRPSS
jgi:hypothetical protein